MEQIKAIYIHIPFCNTICSYCDFCKMFYNKNLVDSYSKELANEIKESYKEGEIATIYIGGGTPTCISVEQLSFLFSLLKDIKLTTNYEFTIEANVESLTEEKIKLLKNNRVNRISIGVETFNENYQKTINRKTSYEALKEKVKLLREHGISNINLDLMYGFQNETVDILAKDIDNLLTLAVPHISIYSLILEEHTKLQLNNYQRLDEDKDQELYKFIEEKLNNAGYKHYEISNYAKEGYESRHDLVYWNNEEYYGFGLSAASYYNNIRKTNTRSITNYLKGKREIESEKLTLKDKMDYELILGLRLEEGLSLEKFANKYNSQLNEIYNYQYLIDKGVLKITKGKLSVNKEYRYVLNEILSEIL